jgi:hypothetical protein
MSMTEPVSTWELLKDLGFTPDPGSLSEGGGGLVFDFGNLQLSAGRFLNMRVLNIILLSGVLATSRTIAEISQEMPLHVDSREQGIALVVWCLDQASSRGEFIPLKSVPWIAEERAHRDCLPWKRDAAIYAARPHCLVSREWMRIGIKTLASHIVSSDNDALVSFGFDGSALSIRCTDNPIIMAAAGAPWPQQYSVHAKTLRWLPKRLMRDEVEVSVHDGFLRIGRRLYRLAEDDLMDQASRDLQLSSNEVPV